MLDSNRGTVAVGRSVFLFMIKYLGNRLEHQYVGATGKIERLESAKVRNHSKAKQLCINFNFNVVVSAAKNFVVILLRLPCTCAFAHV